MDVKEKFQRPMQRQIAEGVAIHRDRKNKQREEKSTWLRQGGFFPHANKQIDFGILRGILCLD
jgi:hypothetical protein